MMLNSTAANMYPWYRDSMSQLSQYCSASNIQAIKTENGYTADCMMALDYAHNKVRNYFKSRSLVSPQIDASCNLA